MQEILTRASKIRLMIFDVDGVLTDGSLYIGDDGIEYKAFNVKDGLGMKLLQKSGVEVAIITAKQSNLVKIRMEGLGIKHLYQGQHKKLPAFESLRKQLGLDYDQVAYVGDDVIDLPVMRKVGLSIAVADAHALVKEHAHWQTRANGGKAAAREACEMIMQAQGNLERLLGEYL